MSRLGKMLLIIILVCLFSAYVSASETYPWKMWQFHAMKPDYIRQMMATAGEYDINTVVFSHWMIKRATDILEKAPSDGESSAFGWRPSKRGRELQQLAQEAHRLNLKAIIWIHELEFVPDQFLEGGKVRLDDDALLAWIQDKYRAVYTLFPEFDGIMLTFHETRYMVFDEEKIISHLSMPDRFVRLINALDEVYQEFDKTFIVRTFVYEPQELAWLYEGLKKVSDKIIIQTKCIPHDWHPFYPHNPLIGKFPGRRQIIEFDCSSEYTGRNRIPYCNPEYFLMRWRYDRQFSEVAGYNARLDHAGYDAFYTPNQINLYTLYRVLQKPDITADEIWREWTAKTYGPQAAPFVEKALRPTVECVNKTLYAHHSGFTNHSKLPDYDYTFPRLRRFSLSKWSPDDKQLKRTEDLLVDPTPEFYESILAEKDQAVALADECLARLRAAKPHLTAEQYDDLRFRFDLLRRTTEVWRLYAEAFFGFRLMEQGNPPPGLEARVRRALDALELQAKISEQDPRIGNDPPACAKNIRYAIGALEKRWPQQEK
ncbi:MAG: hypothetical protein JW709_08180 [Sedimentisphaerales bacterium]|nr:hypothetical protein [Sedimentisphaerales bacterium]